MRWNFAKAFEMLFERGLGLSPSVVPDKRSEAERRSGTHNHREMFDEDCQLAP